MIHPETVVFDIETTPNCFTLNAQSLFGNSIDMLFEISHFRDDRESMLAWFEYWHTHQIPMIGYNSLGFDYPVIHEFWTNPYISVEELYDHAMLIIGTNSRFAFQIWQRDRFTKQIDLMKVHHFDNPAKMTSLKALQFAMRAESVMEAPIQFGVPLTREQIDQSLIPYNRHDVKETKRFALFSMEAIKFRVEMSAMLNGDVLNFADTKIGAKLMEQRLGKDLCYDENRQPRKTYRSSIALDDIIFPYIKFQQPEFNRVLDWMRQQRLTPDELSESKAIRTKGVFKGVKATVAGLEYVFGTGGIHGSVEPQRIVATEQEAIVDIDVTGLYPSVGIVNRLYPEHLGEKFVEEYAKLPKERAQYAKGTAKNLAFKLAANGGVYGNSNSEHSVFYDPKFPMTITVNGQLMIAMLAEWLLTVPTLRVIQCNTDGITYRIQREWMSKAEEIRTAWERYTLLALEEVEYSRMWIRDVNSYVAEPAAHAGNPNKLKQKGAFWFPRRFPEDMDGVWHKDFSAAIIIKAAVEHMVTGCDLDRFVYSHRDAFDFMLRAKVDRSSKLMIGDQEVQRICRYYVALDGGEMKKISPPPKGSKVGDFKRKPKVTDWDFHTITQEVGEGVWDARIHTAKKTRHEIREFGIEAGFKVADCCVASEFDWSRLNYQYYIDAAQKLVIA